MVQSSGKSRGGGSGEPFGPQGLPIGVQIVGRPWEEEQVLAVAAALERKCGAWTDSAHLS